jgi:hypothetical protein
MMAKELARDLDKYGSGIYLIIGTDRPDEFKDIANILAFKFQQQGILHCYNDKRFVLEKALAQFQTAIYTDADTRIVAHIPNNLNYSPGIDGCYRNLVAHVSKYRPQNLEMIENVATKLGIPLHDVNWIGESLFIVTKGEDKEKEFLKIWGLLASYLELKGMHSGEGSIMGLAASKVGWKVRRSDTWETINQIRKHLDASDRPKKLTFEDKLKRRLGYHYRLNKLRLIALTNFNFYYR